MFQSKFNSTLISVTLAFVMLISVLAASYVVPTRAQPITLNALLSPDPFWGYYGGYWDIWYEMQPELAKIGIDVQLIFKSDIYDIWQIMWSPSVPEGGQPSGVWDAIMMEWWTQPQGFLWMDGIILSKNLINGELAGYNPFPYLSEANDEFYWGMQTNFAVATRKAYADAWQAEMMHNPPVINVYYPHVYSVRGDYFEGYDEYCWTNQVSHVNLNLTRVQEMYAAANLSATAYDRLYNQKTITYAASEAWWNLMPPYVDSYTEEEFQTLIFQTLYRLNIDPWPAEDAAADPQEYDVIPWLATSDPIWIEEFTDWDGETVTRYRIPLREGIQWSDGHVFDAEDVVWTYNEIALDPTIGCTAAGDFAPIVKRAEYIGNYTPGSPSYNPNALDLIVYEPYVDLTLILANDWGLAIVPYHYFGGVPPKFQDPANKKFGGPTGAVNVPALGPFKYEAEGSPPSYSWVSLVRNNKYFGFNTSIVGSPAWGPYNVNKWIFQYTPEASQRLLKIQLHDADYGEYPTSPIEVFEKFLSDPNFAAGITFYPGSNPVWLNLNNPDLSNRYTRLALAHAIPYADIFKDVLPSWGITEPIPGGSLLHPWQYYGGVQLWNSKMPRYKYDLTIAQKYLDMYLYSKTGSDYTKGPVGDANFDGVVDLDDLYYWIEEYGNAPLTRTLENEAWLDPDWYTSYPWPAGVGDSVAPGNDIDADFDNSGITGPEDYGYWLANVGKEYPFSGAF